jgi:hypothetical protein
LFDHVKAKLRALLPTDWWGEAGDRFRATGLVLSEYNRDHLHLGGKLDEAPDLAWNRIKGEANEKYYNSLKSFEEIESVKLANELARRTVEDKIREAKATADKAESSARLAAADEMKARLDLLARCKDLGVFPFWDATGNMRFEKAAANVDWDEISNKLLAESAESPKSQVTDFTLEQIDAGDSPKP